MFLNLHRYSFDTCPAKVDWSLPMTSAAQVIYFKKVKALFQRSTVGVSLAAKKKYRLTQEELTKVRNLCVLFSQLWPHLKARLPEIESRKWESGFVQGTSYDDDFVSLLETRPSKVAWSMLRSQKEAAQKQEREKQNAILSEVETQREAVQDAQWKFFCTALRQDQALLSKVKGVPEKVKAKLHEKAVVQRLQQSEAGQKATTGHQD